MVEQLIAHTLQLQQVQRLLQQLLYGQMAVQAGRLAAQQLAGVGIFLLRHQRGAGAKRIRQLDEAERTGVTDDASAQALMLARVTVIRRPIVEIDTRLVVGFDPTEYAAVFPG